MKKQTIKNTILLLCGDCGRMVLTPRAEYEHGELTKKAVCLKSTCEECLRPGEFYGDEEEYFGENGFIAWYEEETNQKRQTT